MTFLTSKGQVQSETFALCQKKKLSNGHARTNVKGSPLPPRQVNSCAKKWSIFGRGNTVHVRRNRRSPLVCQKHDGPVSSYRRRSEARREQNVKPSATW